MTRLLIRGADLIGLSGEEEILLSTDLYAENGRVRAVGPEALDAARAPGEPVERLEAEGKWVIPGFVQAHLHLCQTLLRNGPENLELLPWLKKHVWPGEAAHDAATMSVSARLGLSECLASGVTAVLDMGTVRHSGAIFEAAARAGIRYTGGNVLMDDPATTPPDLRASAAEGLAETERLRQRWHGREEGRLAVAVSPRFAISCTEGLLRAAALYAREKLLAIHTHASENVSEVALVRKRTGLGNVDYLERVGLLTEATCLAHAIHTDGADWKRLASRGTSVVHCPSSNMRLSSGVAPIVELQGAGVRVALGSDGAACNNSLDPFREMRLACFLAETRAPAVKLPARAALCMATVEGARALPLPGGEGFGIGARADFTVLDPEAAWALPEDWSSDRSGAIVYSMGRENVFATIVDGIVRYRAGDPTVGGLKPTAEEVRRAVKSLRSRM